MIIQNTPGLQIDGRHRYTRDGERFLNVTAITKRADDGGAGLIAWSRNMAAERFYIAMADGKQMDEAYTHARKADTSAAEFGTEVHGLIETGIMTGNIPDTPAGALARNAVDWFYHYGLKDPHNEVMLCDTPIAGTIDCVAQAVDGGVVVLDWKTSGRVYPGYVAQIGGYQRLLAAHGVQAQYGAVIRIDKKTGQVEPHWINLAQARDIFDKALDLHLAVTKLDKA